MLKIIFFLLTSINLFCIKINFANAQHSVHKFDKIMIIIFENMSVSDTTQAITFKNLLNNANTQSKPNHHEIGYAFIKNYYNNHNGGIIPTRSSQPNYLALTSGSTHNIIDNNNHDINADNLGAELIKNHITWKVYAEDLNESATNKQCYTTGMYNNYVRKHEPFISYNNIHNDPQLCKNIVNADHLLSNLNHNTLPQVSFYIPNLIHDGHNGALKTGINNANIFLSQMLGYNPKTGIPLRDNANAPLQIFIKNNGLLIITFDEPSLLGNKDLTIYTMLIGKMINNGIYEPTCYPNKQPMTDKNGLYPTKHCNHYNLLKLIETNWSLSGLKPDDTSYGYKYSYPLTISIPKIWK